MAVAQLIVRNHWQGKKRTITQSLGVVPASSPRTSALIPESIPESRRMAFVRIMKLHFRSLKRGSCRILSLFPYGTQRHSWDAISLLRPTRNVVLFTAAF